MSARNIYHDAVVAALIADGWTITDDPLRVEIGDRNLYVDLAAEKSVLGAEKAGRQIAVEIQSFISPSAVHDLEVALGQYSLYRIALTQEQPDRTLFMAVPAHTYESLFQEPLGLLILKQMRLRIVVFDDLEKKVTQWIE